MPERSSRRLQRYATHRAARGRSEDRTSEKRLTDERLQVEPQEKKKVPKGRAKKRIQYTRRFVNVTMTGGKRKMNPNPTS